MSTIRYAVFMTALTATVAIGGCTGNNAQPRSIHATTSQTMPDRGTQAPSAVATPSPTARAIAQAAGAPGGSARADSAHPGGALPTNVEAYAELFVSHWVRGDRGGAEQLGTPESVSAIFAAAETPAAAPALRDCEGAAGSSYCTFDGVGYTLIVRLGNEAVQQGKLHAVIEVRFAH
jgi:hypothetical protein